MDFKCRFRYKDSINKKNKNKTAVNKVTDENIDPALYDGELIEFVGTEFNTVFTKTGGLYLSNGISWVEISTTPSYKVYMANVTSSGGVITVTELLNTTGGTVSFVHGSVGIWTINSSTFPDIGGFGLDPSRVVPMSNGHTQFQAYQTVRGMVYYQSGVGMRLLVTDGGNAGSPTQIDDFTQPVSVILYYFPA